MLPPQISMLGWLKKHALFFNETKSLIYIKNYFFVSLIYLKHFSLKNLSIMYVLKVIV